jgi:hypothetical protein
MLREIDVNNAANELQKSIVANDEMPPRDVIANCVHKA